MLYKGEAYPQNGLYRIQVKLLLNWGLVIILAKAICGFQLWLENSEIQNGSKSTVAV